jgi:hypothetical protein
MWPQFMFGRIPPKTTNKTILVKFANSFDGTVMLATFKKGLKPKAEMKQLRVIFHAFKKIIKICLYFEKHLSAIR